ncbi:MAG: PAS domain S-box protein [Thermodesulfobacteriota bacterium]|nr:PAS domain S-box protein [Thermodesulfobacteriota bacterium]
MYRKIVEDSLTCILVVTADTIHFANKAFEEITGYTLQDRKAMGPWDLVYPDDRERIHKIGCDLLCSKDSRNIYETRWILKNGRSIWVEVRATSIEQEGEPAILMNAVDITERKQAEEEKRLNDERYRLYFDNVSDIMFSVDKDFTVLSVSPSIKKILGYTPEEMVGRSFLDINFISPDSIDDAISYTRNILKGEEIPPPVFKLISKDGSLRFAEVTAAPLIKSGAIVAGVALARDITEWRSAEKMLREAEEKYRLYFENVSDVIFSVDLNFTVVDISSSVEKILGYTPEEIIGGSFLELNLLSSDSLRTALSKAECILAGQQTESSVYEFIAKDGTIRLGEVNSAPLIRDGKIVQVVSVGRDITERKRAEEALQESEEIYRNTLNDSPNPIFSIGTDGAIRIWNRACEKVFQYKKEEIIGQQYERLLENRDDLDCMDVMLRKVFDGEFMTDKEMIYRCKDGTTKHTISRLFPLSGKKILECLVANTDITERRHAEEELRKAHDDLEMRVRQRTAELEKANKALQWEIIERKEAEEAAEAANIAKSRFLANMSHELRTPLNAIIGFTELIVDKKFGEINRIQEEYLNDALQSSRYLLSLINDILDLSKVEAGKLELCVSEFDLKDLIRESLIMVREKAIKHNIQLLTDIKRIPPIIKADQRQLKQVMYNLLSNAVKFTPDGGKIHLSVELTDGSKMKAQRMEGQFQCSVASVEPDQDWIQISVKDTGIGIKAEDLKQLFRPFHQVDGSMSRKYEGTGLGLSLSRRFVELHGGMIWAESKGEGRGCKFSIAIPLSESEGTEKNQLPML